MKVIKQFKLMNDIFYIFLNIKIYFNLKSLAFKAQPPLVKENIVGLQEFT